MIASLGMYDRPETAAANDRLWAATRAALGHGPRRLTRDRDFDGIWRDPELLLAQTCGMPYRMGLYRQVQLVATPDHALPDCPAGHYYSVFLCHADRAQATLEELCQGVFAYNEPMSQSGWAAPLTHLGGLGLAPRSRLQTGAHVLSARAVAEGKASFAALDALSWEMIRRYDGFAADLHMVARSASTPALPYITGPRGNPRALRQALATAIAGLSTADRAVLGLTGLVEIPASAYLAVPTPAAP
ncbi:phosphate/phosphite/phosphonate ABC transporter substrate-binding protein [Shimia sp.]|uniref:phosphate/phosphite/phosphonate ABC transporter substrate-binding protein n=1 Tax=Shimia sp. TaxID=1954381 RepID=UPI00356147CE